MQQQVEVVVAERHTHPPYHRRVARRTTTTAMLPPALVTTTTCSSSRPPPPLLQPCQTNIEYISSCTFLWIKHMEHTFVNYEGCLNYCMFFVISYLSLVT